MKVAAFRVKEVFLQISLCTNIVWVRAPRPPRAPRGSSTGRRQPHPAGSAADQSRAGKPDALFFLSDMPGGYHANMKAWEPEEDDIIVEMLATKGPRWKIISKALPGRTVRMNKSHARACTFFAPFPLFLTCAHPICLLPSVSLAGIVHSQPLATY